MLMTKRNEIINKLHRDHVATWRLLETNPDFQKRIAECRTRLEGLALQEALEVQIRCIEDILEEFSLPISFRGAVSTFLWDGKIDVFRNLPAKNFSIKPIPWTGEIYNIHDDRRFRMLQVHVYARLSKEELGLLGDELRSWSEQAFPKSGAMQRKRQKKNLERDLKVEELTGQVHSAKPSDVRYTGYLALLYQDLVRKGKDPEKDPLFRKLKKQLPDDVQKDDPKKTTYGDVAIKLGLRRAQHNEVLKQASHRLKRSRKEHFKEKRTRALHPDVERWRRDSESLRKKKERKTNDPVT